MIDLRLLRDNLDAVRAVYAKRGGVPELDRVVALDEAYREILSEVEELRAEHNRSSRAIGKASPEERSDAIAKAKERADQLKILEPKLEAATRARDEAAAYLPNLPHESVPNGLSEDDNVVERQVGDKPEFDFEALDHVALGERLGIFDNERAAKTSGSRFVYLIGPGVMLELALVRFAFDSLMERGFTPIVPPVLVRRHAMYGTGFLPAEEHEFYTSERDDLYLTGTSEVALAAMHSGETLQGDSLPRRYAGFSTNFRREAGTY
ncbi:MAG: serine--tRNA ligase, partial [Actinobacteria bacterium]|nr:serine--tRNA ligase [Actinomycetota bacterium]